MGISEMLGMESMLGDVQRMDKRQVSTFAAILSKLSAFQVYLVGTGCSFLIYRDCIKNESLFQFFYQVLSFGMIVSSALMIWKGLMVVTGSESPIVVVLSGSMEPAFHRGDLLLLTNYREEPVRVGEIVVFKVEGRDIPIVHRVIKMHEKNNATVKFLTKGDNNSVDDRGLYAPGQMWLTKRDIVGRARGFLPYVGMVTILMNEYPNLKYAILGILALYVLLHRE